MAYTLKKSVYDGVDGTNISDCRCEQYLQLMNLCDKLGDEEITYKKLQKIADKQKLFGETKASSAVRTICPILNKFGFVISYQRIDFPANTFFTPVGKMFLKILNALQSMPLNPNNQVVNDKLIKVKSRTIQLGMLNMARNNPDHKIWLLIYSLKILGYVDKNVYYYMLKAIQEKVSVANALETVEVEPTVVDDVYLREDGNPMDSTNYGYLIANLKDAGLVNPDENDNSCVPTDDFNRFFDLLRGLSSNFPQTNLSLIYECN